MQHCVERRKSANDIEIKRDRINKIETEWKQKIIKEKIKTKPYACRIKRRMTNWKPTYRIKSISFFFCFVHQCICFCDVGHLRSLRELENIILQFHFISFNYLFILSYTRMSAESQSHHYTSQSHLSFVCVFFFFFGSVELKNEKKKDT